MAQLYKMTLYVCDLEESLSLDEIETLIKHRALDGVSVSCICRFADSQIGKQVEWDDDIDLNQRSCPTSAWDKYFTPPTKPQTHADRIRAMSDEELAEFLCGVYDMVDDCCYDQRSIKEWLKQPAEE